MCTPRTMYDHCQSDGFCDLERVVLVKAEEEALVELGINDDIRAGGVYT